MDNLKKYFIQYFWDVVKNQYADFTGLATRKQFWLFFAWNYALSTILYMGTQFIVSILFVFNDKLGLIAGAVLMLVSTIISLALFIPALAIQCRRFRDVGLSPWWLLLPFILWGITAVVMVSTIILLVMQNADSAQMPYASLVVIIFIILLFLSFLSFVAWLVVLILPSGYFDKGRKGLNITQNNI